MGEPGADNSDINTGFIRDSKGLENLFTRDADSNLYDEDFGGSKVIKPKETVMSTMGAAGCISLRRRSLRVWMETPTGISEIHDEYWHPHADRITHRITITRGCYMSTKEEDFTGVMLFFMMQTVPRPAPRAKMTSTRP